MKYDVLFDPSPFLLIIKSHNVEDRTLKTCSHERYATLTCVGGSTASPSTGMTPGSCVKYGVVFTGFCSINTNQSKLLRTLNNFCRFSMCLE